MSTEPRLFLDLPLAAGARLPLPREAAHYLLTVLRRKAGQGVRIFNGREGEWRALIVEAGRRDAVLEIEKQLREQVAAPDLLLLFAPVKKAKTDLVLEKAAELGAAAIQPVLTERSQTDRVNLERFEAIVREAAEQTERLDLPQVRPLVKLDQALDGWDAGRPLFYCDEAGDDPDEAWGGARGRARPMAQALANSVAGKAAILVGPEGGFTPAERDRLRGLDFCHAVGLGPRILRAETAAIAAMTLWQAFQGDWGGVTSA